MARERGEERAGKEGTGGEERDLEEERKGSRINGHIYSFM